MSCPWVRIEIEIDQEIVVQSSFFNCCLTDDDLQVAHNKEYHIAASASFLYVY